MEPITSTAQALQLAQGLDLHATARGIFAVLLGLALSPTLQATLEHNVMEKPWMKGRWAGLKPALPFLVSQLVGLIGGYALSRFGITQAEAEAAAAALGFGAHLVNASSMAADAIPGGSEKVFTALLSTTETVGDRHAEIVGDSPEARAQVNERAKVTLASLPVPSAIPEPVAARKVDAYGKPLR